MGISKRALSLIGVKTSNEIFGWGKKKETSVITIEDEQFGTLKIDYKHKHANKDTFSIEVSPINISYNNEGRDVTVSLYFTEKIISKYWDTEENPVQDIQRKLFKLFKDNSKKYIEDSIRYLNKHIVAEMALDWELVENKEDIKNLTIEFFNKHFKFDHISISTNGTMYLRFTDKGGDWIGAIWKNGKIIHDDYNEHAWYDVAYEFFGRKKKEPTEIVVIPEERKASISKGEKQLKKLLSTTYKELSPKPNKGVCPYRDDDVYSLDDYVSGKEHAYVIGHWDIYDLIENPREEDREYEHVVKLISKLCEDATKQLDMDGYVITDEGSDWDSGFIEVVCTKRKQ